MDELQFIAIGLLSVTNPGVVRVMSWFCTNFKSGLVSSIDLALVSTPDTKLQRDRFSF